MDFFNVVKVDRARELIMENFKEYKFETETVDILKSRDRVLSKNIFSIVDVPDFDRSTVDGYAIDVDDSYGASQTIPSILEIIGEVKMGKWESREIESGETMYVPTGGMIPKGANGMIMIENIQKMDKDTLLLYKPITIGENIILKGNDIKKSSLILKKGKKIDCGNIGVLASLGIKRVEVFKKPKFYIISTGDEIIDIDKELTPGKIRDINSYTLHTLIEDIGGEVVGRQIVNDDYTLLKDATEKAIDMSDIVLLSGGSSVGTRDFTYKVVDSFPGKGIFVHGMNIKPGKPTIIAEAKGKLVIGLPGHPVSSIIVFKALVEDYINKKFYIDEIPSQVNGKMKFNFPSSPGKTTYQMVTLEKKGGEYFAMPSFGKSGMISMLSNSDGYIVLQDYEEGIYKGEMKTVYLL